MTARARPSRQCYQRVDEPVTRASADSQGEPTRSSKSGPRLTNEQRETVKQLMAQYMNPTSVQAVLRSDYPEYPSISDRYLRLVRENVVNGKDASFAERLQTEQASALRHGLAKKEHRVTELSRMYGQVLAREATERDPHQLTSLLRERRAILEQIEREVAPWSNQLSNGVPSSAATKGPGSAAGTAVGSPSLADLLDMLHAQLWAADRVQALDLSIYPADSHESITKLYQMLQTGVTSAQKRARAEEQA